MLKFPKQLGITMRLMQLPKAHKRIVFYSESPDYRVHLSGLVKKH